MNEDRASLTRDLDVLEENKLFASASLAALVAGPLLLAAFAAGLFPPGILGLHLLIGGLLLRFSNRRLNLRARRRRASVTMDRDGVWENGALVVARTAIADGFFQPRAGRDRGNPKSYGSSIRLVDKRRRVLFEAEADEAEALTMLQALGLDPSSKRAQFHASSPLYATLGRNLLFLVGVVGFTMALSTLLVGVATSIPLGPLLVLPLIFAGMLPSKVEVGADGILQRWLWTKSFIPIAQIASVSPGDDRTIHVHLRNGGEEAIYTSARRRGGVGSSWAKQHRDAILARIRETLAANAARGQGADVSMLVAKGTRSRADWLASLDKLRDREGGYRDAVVRDDDLWRVVEDPSAPEDARGAAALLLRSSLDDAGRARVRIAAEATASPKLRVALDAAAGPEEDASVRSALEELAGDDAPEASPRRVAAR